MPAPRGRKAAPAQPSSEPSKPLAEYDRKRDFSRTPEPAGTPQRGQGPLTFVVHKHAATRLHYDLRLEWDGVMPSWAVPKGPSSRIGDKHLAVHVEDHPLSYAKFEGLIPKGEYGGGEVIIWDAGTYSPDEGGYLSFDNREEAEQRMREGLAAGKLGVTFRGHKLKGSYALVRTNKMESGREQWLMLKHRDETASDHDLTAENRSVVSDLTIEDLQRGIVPAPDHVTPAQPTDLRGAHWTKFPTSIEPMAAAQRPQAFDDAHWRFEPKLDGMRALALLEDGEVRLVSRRGLNTADRFPGVAKAVLRQPASTLILDGEIVALDENGTPSFELMQKRMHLSGSAEIARAESRVPVLYYVFDLLYLDGLDLRSVPLEDRLTTLRRVLMPTYEVRLLEAFETDGVTAYAIAQAHGLEGIVAKRRNSTYDSGRRSRSWVKVKTRTSDEFVVGGYAAGEGARSHSFGSLLIGRYDEQGELHYWTHVGSGFTDATLHALKARLDALEVKQNPFAEQPPKVDHDTPTWVRPELVVEVAYTQLTSDHHLRAPVFLHLREDRDPSELVGDPVEPNAQAQPVEAPRPALITAAPAAPSLDLEVRDVLDQLGTGKKQLTLAMGAHELKLSNLDKELWPATAQSRALTKRDLLEYFARMARWILPHVHDRPITMTRYPNGITSSYFYQKHVPETPPFVETVQAYTDTEIGDQTFVLCNNLPTLMWLAQMADLALHTTLARVGPEPDAYDLPESYTGTKANMEASRLNYPDFILFDLDPYTYAGTEEEGAEPELNRAAWEQVVHVARWLKELLDTASLASFIKTSGATGLHIYVPIMRHYDYGIVRDLAGTFASILAKAHPQDVTIEWQTQRRAGKVFFDHNQNARIKNLAAPYSPRAKPGGPVSMPIRWEELGNVYPDQFTILNAHVRLERVGDVWADILKAKHDLRAIIEPST